MCVVGRTALHWAAAVNNEEAARDLIKHHTNVDAQDEYNQTALFLAAREGSYQVARMLLQHGKANADLPDHMERFPRDIALERQHHDIAQLIEEFSYGLSTLPLPQTTAASLTNPHVQGSAGKSRSKKSSASQRKQSARSANGDASREDDGLLWRLSETDPARRPDQAVSVRPKKTKRPRAPPAQSASQSQVQSAAKLYTVLKPDGVRLFSPEQPPSYENAINGRRAQLAAMQQTPSMVSDSHSIYHTGVMFEEQQQFGANPDIGYARMMPMEMAGSHPQPTGVVLLPGSYLAGGLVEADPSQIAHSSPTVPSCHAYSPQNMAAMQVPETTVVSSGPRSQPLSPMHRQMLQQRFQLHQNQNPHHHHRHQHHQQHHPHPLQADNFDPSTAAYLSPVSAVPGVTTCTHPTPSSATSGSQIMFQYPTPPSHHGSTTETTSPSLVQQTGNTPTGYPTPSPEASPGQWSSSSPNSAKSPWSEHAQNSSPKQAVTNVTNQSIKNEPAYL